MPVNWHVLLLKDLALLLGPRDKEFVVVDIDWELAEFYREAKVGFGILAELFFLAFFMGFDLCVDVKFPGSGYNNITAKVILQHNLTDTNLIVKGIAVTK